MDSETKSHEAPQKNAIVLTLEVLEQFEKSLHEQNWRLKQSLGELTQRVCLLEQSREREFNIELERRLRLTSDGGSELSDTFVATAQESIASRLNRVRQDNKY